MILRRVITHVRQQNWTAIGMDFVVVSLRADDDGTARAQFVYFNKVRLLLL